MDIDVIIPVYRPGEELRQLLGLLESQTLKPSRILLINTEKSYFEEAFDREQFLQEHPTVRLYHVTKQQFDHGGTRRSAVRKSEAPIFVMMTQDAIPQDAELLERLTRPLRDRLEGNVPATEPAVAVCYARQLPGENSSVLERISRSFNYPEKSCVKTAADLDRLGIKTFFCSDVCAAYRRDLYDKLGGFVRKTIFNEDMIFASAAIRGGYAVRYEAEARVIHAHNYTNLQQLHRNFDLGVSQAQHPEVFSGLSSESEGKKLVATAVKELKASGEAGKIPGFYLQCAFKYLGYQLGKHYRILPRKLVLKLTTNREYWTDYKEND
jgi:rhamnosyltransferase